jgi:hypothetical protein
MGTYRIYTGDDGQSHFQAIDLAKTQDWTKGMPTTNITFREAPVGNFQDWHPAPRRQFVIILSGQLEIGFGDGTKQVFGPGDARLVEDTNWTIMWRGCEHNETLLGGDKKHGGHIVPEPLCVGAADQYGPSGDLSSSKL